MKLIGQQLIEVEIAVHARIKLLKERIVANPNGTALYEKQLQACQEALAELQKEQP